MPPMSSYEMQPTNDDMDYDFDDLLLAELSDDQSLADSFDEDAFWLEDELISDFHPDLHQPLHDALGDSDTMTIELRVDELVASAVEVTEAERRQISEMLTSLKTGQLRYWLPRLRQKSWSGHSLILFLKFRKIWDGKEKWWESVYWNPLLEVWYPVWSRYNLTLENIYLLVQLRPHCNPANVIEETWFEEWEESQRLWTHGYFLSFAKYALSRAEYPDREKWLLYLNTIKENLEC